MQSWLIFAITTYKSQLYNYYMHSLLYVGNILCGRCWKIQLTLLQPHWALFSKDHIKLVSHLRVFAQVVSSVSAMHFAQILPWVYSLPHSGLCSNATFSKEASLIFPHEIDSNSHLLFSLFPLSFFIAFNSTQNYTKDLFITWWMKQPLFHTYTESPGSWREPGT